MKVLKTFLVVALLTVGLNVAMAEQPGAAPTPSAGTPVPGADAQAVDSACAADAKTANCGTDQVGTGLLKCLHAYKKSNPGYKFSSACHAAMEKMHMDRKHH